MVNDPEAARFHKRAWPGKPIPAKPPDVRLVEQPLMAWWARTDRPRI
jgi:hypothetical protein